VSCELQLRRNWISVSHPWNRKCAVIIIIIVFSSCCKVTGASRVIIIVAVLANKISENVFPFHD
jgi:hypothetical protein